MITCGNSWVVVCKVYHHFIDLFKDVVIQKHWVQVHVAHVVHVVHVAHVAHDAHDVHVVVIFKRPVYATFNNSIRFYCNFV